MMELDMYESLLVRLSSYRPRAERGSRENFITEAFCWLLQTYEPFSETFLLMLSKRMGENGEVFLERCDEIYWTTQKPLAGKRPDMTAEGRHITLFFEHKVEALPEVGQLMAYRERAADIEHRLILIAPNRFDFEKNLDCCLTWRDLVAVIDRFSLEQGERVDALMKRDLSDFRALLVHEDLGPVEPVSRQAIRYYPIAEPLPRQLVAVFSPARDDDWEIDGFCVAESGLEQRWGRVGSSLERQTESIGCEWYPGIFIGCVIDGKDHRVQRRIADEGIKFSLIMDFDRKLHDEYPKLVSYKALCDELLLLNRDDSTSQWVFYDQLRDPQEGINKFHPLHLEYSLESLMTGSRERTASEQRSRMIAKGNEGLRLLQQAGLQALIDEIDAKFGGN